MQKYIPTFTDISEWDIQIYRSTGGTRTKRIAINPKTEKEYFFKGSKELPTGEIRYPMEFWSEIASSKIGQYFGFNMLDYNIAFHKDQKQQIGCLSQSMIKSTENRLSEGIGYLIAINPNYNPERDKKDYTFQFIAEALRRSELSKHISKLVEVIVYDALIGNSDRHQENWGFIIYFKETIDLVDKTLNDPNTKYIKSLFLKFYRFYLNISKLPSIIPTKLFLKLQSELVKIEFSPIYDSGCCLGREIEDDRLIKTLKNDDMLKAYLRKGVSEIHWKGLNDKQNHFELVKLLIPAYKEKIFEIIKRIQEKNNTDAISEIINNIDRNLPEELAKFKLPDFRKELMIKLISLRAQKLEELL